MYVYCLLARDIANSNGQGQQAVDKLDKWKSCHDIFFSRNALIVHYGQFSWVICMLQSSLQSDCPRSRRCFWQAYNVPWYIASADKMWHQSCWNFPFPEKVMSPCFTQVTSKFFNILKCFVSSFGNNKFKNFVNERVLECPVCASFPSYPICIFENGVFESLTIVV